jgi:hypothetical protein
LNIILLKKNNRPGVEAHAWNHIYLGDGDPEKSGSRPVWEKDHPNAISTNKPGMVAHTCAPAMWQAWVGGSQSEASSKQKHKALSKETN